MFKNSKQIVPIAIHMLFVKNNQYQVRCTAMSTTGNYLHGYVITRTILSVFGMSRQVLKRLYKNSCVNLEFGNPR